MPFYKILCFILLFYQINSIINETGGFSRDDLRTMEMDENVASVAAMQFSLYLSDGKNTPKGISLGFNLQPGESFQIVGLNNAYWDGYFGEKMSVADLKLLKSGAGCIVRNPIPLVLEGEEVPQTTIEAGSTITVAVWFILLVLVIGFTLSTLSLKLLRKYWEKKITK